MSNGTGPYVVLAPIGQQGPAGPAGGIGTITPVTTWPYTAAAVSAYNIYTLYNTTGNPITFYLPEFPAAKQVVQVLDAGLTAGSAAQTIDGNGNNIIAYGTSVSSLEINSAGGTISLAWDGINWVQNG